MQPHRSRDFVGTYLSEEVMAAIIDDLFCYNAWANDRLFAMSQGLTDSQLDE